MLPDPLTDDGSPALGILTACLMALPVWAAVASAIYIIRRLTM